MAALVHEVFAEVASRHGDKPALRVKRGGAWRTLTWSSYEREARRVARGLLALGVRAGQGVAIIGNNSPEWVIADVGAILAGAMPAGIYTTSSPAQVRYITDHCGAHVAFADTPEQVEKFLAEKDKLPSLRAIVQMTGEPRHTSVGELRVLAWIDLLELGDEVPESTLNERLATLKPDDVCTLIYTSGTTGEPKAVMITHTNLVWTAQAILDAVGVRDASLVGLSYLPLSHVAEQLLSIHGPMTIGAVVHFTDNMEKLGEALTEVRPTLFLGVPRVWEKIQAKITMAAADAPPSRKKLAAWARKLGLEGGYAEQRGEKMPRGYRIAKKLVFDTVRKRLGLDRAKYCVTSAAPISKDTLEFFLSLGIPILEVYGMSECTGPATYSPPDAYRTGKTGVILPGTELKIAEDGEVCMRGKHVFKGYLHDPGATEAAIDEQGWLHSGDIGFLDDRGYLQITDRKKDLLITAGGENVAPQVIEGFLKAIPAVAQAVVVGDRRKYLGALLTLDPERLPAEVRLAGSSARTIEEASRCATFRRYMDLQLEGINAKLARVQTIKRYAILDRDFSIEGGELTPTMKVKRKLVNSKYRNEIESLYADERAN